MNHFLSVGEHRRGTCSEPNARSRLEVWMVGFTFFFCSPHGGQHLSGGLASINESFYPSRATAPWQTCRAPIDRSQKPTSTCGLDVCVCVSIYVPDTPLKTLAGKARRNGVLWRVRSEVNFNLWMFLEPPFPHTARLALTIHHVWFLRLRDGSFRSQPNRITLNERTWDCWVRVSERRTKLCPLLPYPLLCRMRGNGRKYEKTVLLPIIQSRNQAAHNGRFCWTPGKGSGEKEAIYCGCSVKGGTRVFECCC